MRNTTSFAKGALIAAAGAAALAISAVPTFASAQAYGAPAYGGYNACQRQAGNRGVMGALVGGGIGAVVGSQAAANHHRTDGSLLGGALGAIAGAVVGNKTAACTNAPPPPPPPPVAAEAPPPPPAPRADYAPPPPPAYGYHNEVVAVAPPPPPYPHHGRYAPPPVDEDGCTLAESPVYMPDGRVQKRMVHVCPDSTGRYQVVE